jgi:hypothetical protein
MRQQRGRCAPWVSRKRSFAVAAGAVRVARVEEWKADERSAVS